MAENRHQFYKLPDLDFGNKAPSCPEELIKLCEANYGAECGTLAHYFTNLASEAWKQRFFVDVFPTIWSIGARLEELFPGRRLSRLLPGQSEVLSLSRTQICCLLVHMFLGRMQPDPLIAFWSNFSVWLCHGFQFFADNDPRLAYVNALLLYFEHFSKIAQSPEASESVIFQRTNLAELPNWELDFTDKKIEREAVEIFQSGRIGDRPGLEVEMDFANKNVGFGATGTQEEILFGCSPELCVAPLFLPTLSDREAALIRGAWKVCDASGYGFTLTTRSRSFDYPIQSRIVLAVDALDFSDIIDADNEQILSLQLEKKNLERELNKLYAGFSALDSELPVASGKWGCGAFQGHPVLKMLLQILAMSAVGARLNLYLFGNGSLENKIINILDHWKGQTVSEAFGMIKRDLFE